VQAQSSQRDDFQDKLVQLGAGPAGGSFVPIANSLCEAINSERKNTLVRCVPVDSAGSVFNIHAVAHGSLQLGLSQEDLLAQAYSNGSVIGGQLLRAVAPLHNTPIAIMVRKASGIADLSQIRKGIVNIGNKGSGDRTNAIAILNAMNLKESDLAGATYLQPTEAIEAFCEGKVDVIINALAHPAPQYRELRACGGEFRDVPPEIIKKMILKNQWLRPMIIPAGMYGIEQGEVATLGMRNLLFTNSGVDEEAIFRVSKLIADQYKGLQSKQIALSSMVLLDVKEVSQLAVPLHSGALRALQKRVP